LLSKPQGQLVLATSFADPLVTIQVEWKLTRGKWRPKLLDYAKHASEEEVVGTTKKAFACLGSAEAPALQKVEEALKELISRKQLRL